MIINVPHYVAYIITNYLGYHIIGYHFGIEYEGIDTLLCTC